MENVRIFPLGDTGITVEFGNDISPHTKNLVTSFNLAFRQLNLEGCLETVPTYRSVSIYYDPSLIEYKQLLRAVKEICLSLNKSVSTKKFVIEIPVWYSNECAPDLEYVASYNNLSVADVIKIHSAPFYLFYMLGFTPVFHYLGGMCENIAPPSLTSHPVKINYGRV